MQGILWFEGQVKVIAIRFFPTSLSDRCKFGKRLTDDALGQKIIDKTVVLIIYDFFDLLKIQN